MPYKLPFTLLFCVLPFLAFSQTYSDLIRQANQHYEAQQYEKSQSVFAQAFALKEGRATDYYNAACSAALAGALDPALDFLQKALEKGWINVRHAKKDTDLNNLHKTKRWSLIIGQMQGKLDAIEQYYNKPLREELYAIYDADQGVRRGYIKATKKHGYDHPLVDSLAHEMTLADSINLIKIERILETYGWVSRDSVGNANSSIFLVIQHAPLQTQQKYLPLMREAVKKGDAGPSQLALLEDRVALREGRKQIYGSQIGRLPETNESYVLPLENPDEVDQRRAEVGLSPLAEYVARWDIEWDVEGYKKNLPKYEELRKE